ncbi:hypothetical protein [Geitlerinema calcuttense]|uniref:Uncharacterized protein n=1 Tax=Geitlerinema calcuttense NRMC-F 0142 TaxID=2922238 RepID=A0ABT7LYF1_9CYAN|nr:hypothetical protein [Geitlerinema calcuttense]MDL5057040.1 hypothetical protein [Geitlerinema calcuttense NRMC-F 0142]
MRPPDDEFSGSVLGCFGWVVSYLVAAFVLFVVVLIACSYFRTTFSTAILAWLGIMMFVSLLFLLKLTEGRG